MDAGSFPVYANVNQGQQMQMAQPNGFMNAQSDILPPKQQEVVDRLRRRMDTYRHRQDEIAPRFEQAFSNDCEAQKQDTNVLQKQFLESKAKRPKKTNAEKKSEAQILNNMQVAKRPIEDVLDNEANNGDEQAAKRQNDGSTQFSVEIVQQLVFRTAANSQPQQISSNVTVKANTAVPSSGQAQELISNNEFPDFPDMIGDGGVVGNDTLTDLLSDLQDFNPDFLKGFDMKQEVCTEDNQDNNIFNENRETKTNSPAQFMPEFGGPNNVPNMTDVNRFQNSPSIPESPSPIMQQNQKLIGGMNMQQGMKHTNENQMMNSNQFGRFQNGFPASVPNGSNNIQQDQEHNMRQSQLNMQQLTQEQRIALQRQSPQQHFNGNQQIPKQEHNKMQQPFPQQQLKMQQHIAQQQIAQQQIAQQQQNQIPQHFQKNFDFKAHDQQHNMAPNMLNGRFNDPQQQQQQQPGFGFGQQMGNMQGDPNLMRNANMGQNPMQQNAGMRMGQPQQMMNNSQRPQGMMPNNIGEPNRMKMMQVNQTQQMLIGQPNGMNQGIQVSASQQMSMSTEAKGNMALGAQQGMFFNQQQQIRHNGMMAQNSMGAGGMPMPGMQQQGMNPMNPMGGMGAQNGMNAMQKQMSATNTQMRVNNMSGGTVTLQSQFIQQKQMMRAQGMPQQAAPFNGNPNMQSQSMPRMSMQQQMPPTMGRMMMRPQQLPGNNTRIPLNAQGVQQRPPNVQVMPNGMPIGSQQQWRPQQQAMQFNGQPGGGPKRQAFNPGGFMPNGNTNMNPNAQLQQQMARQQAQRPQGMMMPNGMAAQNQQQMFQPKPQHGNMPQQQQPQMASMTMSQSQQITIQQQQQQSQQFMQQTATHQQQQMFQMNVGGNPMAHHQQHQQQRQQQQEQQSNIPANNSDFDFLDNIQIGNDFSTQEMNSFDTDSFM